MCVCILCSLDCWCVQASASFVTLSRRLCYFSWDSRYNDDTIMTEMTLSLVYCQVWSLNWPTYFSCVCAADEIDYIDKTTFQRNQELNYFYQAIVLFLCVCVSDCVYYVAVGVSTDSKSSVSSCNLGPWCRDSKAPHKRNWIFVVSQTVY